MTREGWSDYIQSTLIIAALLFLGWHVFTANKKLAEIAKPEAAVEMGVVQAHGALRETIRCKPDGADEYWIDEIVPCGSSTVFVLRDKGGVKGIAANR